MSKNELKFTLKKSTLMIIFGVIIPLILIATAIILLPSNGAVADNNGNTIDDLDETSDLDDKVTIPTDLADGTQEDVPKRKLDLQVIIPSNCADCFDLNVFVENIESLDVEATSLFMYSETQNAKDLIEKYKLEKLPTIIISGEVEKVEELTSVWEEFGTTEEDGSLILRNVPPVFYDIATGEEVGKLKLTRIVTNDCEDCSPPPVDTDFAFLAPPLQIVEAVTFDYTTSEGKELIEKYEIKSVPTAIIEGDLESYQSYSQLQTLFTEVADNVFLMTIPNPIYLDLESGERQGYVDIEYVYSNTCEGCADTNYLENLFVSNFGLKIRNSIVHEATTEEGKELIEKYGFHFLPNAVISGDVEDYDLLLQLWAQIGDTTEDNILYLTQHLIFQDQSFLDLELGEVTTDTSHTHEAETTSS